MGVGSPSRRRPAPGVAGVDALARHPARQVLAPLQGQGLAPKHGKPRIGEGFSDYRGSAQRQGRGPAMRCARCHGSGRTPNAAFGDKAAGVWEPCPDCGGGGVAHCCDGLQVQGGCHGQDVARACGVGAEGRRDRRADCVAATGQPGAPMAGARRRADRDRDGAAAMDLTETLAAIKALRAQRRTAKQIAYELRLPEARVNRLAPLIGPKPRSEHKVARRSARRRAKRKLREASV